LGTRITYVVAITTLIGAVGGLIYNGKSTNLATQQAHQAQQAQASERFSRSVEELGSPSVTVRTGAVFAFAGLMRDGHDDRAIVDILNSFIRLRAREAHAPARPSTTTPPDLAAALQVLRGHQIRLKLVNLSGYDLTGVVLTRADLTRTNLRGADLTGAALDQTLFNGAHLDGARLNGAHLEGAHLDQASMTRTRLTDAYLINATLTGVDLRGADLTGADLTGADLSEAHLSRTNLERADLTGANLTGAHLARAKHSDDATFVEAFCGYPATKACSSAITRGTS
jgi:uncharacterized protein YjbI with pentapeptide repeats